MAGINYGNRVVVTFVKSLTIGEKTNLCNYDCSDCNYQCEADGRMQLFAMNCQNMGPHHYYPGDVQYVQELLSYLTKVEISKSLGSPAVFDEQYEENSVSAAGTAVGAEYKLNWLE